MPKLVFWPATLVIMGLIFLASNMGYLPAAFWNLWPLILIVVGLGGLLTSDRDEWMSMTKKSTRTATKPAAKAAVKAKVAPKKSAKKTAKKK